MKAKAVIRDVGRVMDMPYADVDRIAKQIPPALDMTLDKALAENPVLREMARTDSRVNDVLEMGKRLEGVSRNAGVHAAGVVIAPGPITDYAPLFKSNRDEITTQWAMKEVERVGLLKMDFLGLSTLTLIQDALAEIKRTENVDLDIDNVPLDDAKTYQLFVDGQTYGIFQFESSGMREILRRAKPQRLEDLIAMNALYRPGPLKGGMVDDYINRKAGRSEVKYELRGARADPRRHLRRHRLPGTGHAHGVGAGRLHDGPVRRAAQGHGQEGSQGHGQAARGLHERRAGEGRQREEGQQDLRADGVLRRATASTSRTRPPTRSSRIRPRISRRTTRGTSPRRC